VRCGACGSAFEGQFAPTWTQQLSAEQLAFAQVFLTHRGKIKDVELALGLSYPTVVARLDALVAALDPQPVAHTPPANRRGVLDELAAGHIDVDEAARRLRGG
jgi:hypothetical protein